MANSKNSRNASVKNVPTAFKRAFRRVRLPKLSVFIGKKQIVIASLTLVLGAAVWVNYLYAHSPKEDLLAENYGDTQFVSGGKLTDNKAPASSANLTDSYFAQARIDKQAARDEAKEFLTAMYGGGDSAPEELAVISRDAAALSGYIESEAKVETVLKAQGFDDVLCYLSDKGANIIVRTDGLQPEDAAKIKDALLSEVELAAENITIVEIH